MASADDEKELGSAEPNMIPSVRTIPEHVCVCVHADAVCLICGLTSWVVRSPGNAFIWTSAPSVG